MHDPPQNPATVPHLAGKHSRFTKYVKAHRHFTSDTDSERAIVTLKEWLAGKVAEGDVVSVSLLARRAFAVYLNHCSALYGAGQIETEREVVRTNSRMPNRNLRKRKPQPRRKKKQNQQRQTAHQMPQCC